MKIPKSYVGKEVRLTWLDPCSERTDLATAKKGKIALAKWIERGVIDDLTDGVVRFIQSYAYSAGQSEPDEAVIGWLPEDLIQTCELMEPLDENSNQG